MRAPTDFESRVYAAVAEVPPGRVTTYGALARRVGSGSARAVGQALRRNPFAPQVPCHRAIASDGTIGGYAGAVDGPELRRKRELLAAEGVEFDGSGKLLDLARLLLR
jgi:methylated-DNA-[protein]-cysteine S-methyltransferase